MGRNRLKLWCQHFQKRTFSHLHESSENGDSTLEGGFEKFHFQWPKMLFCVDGRSKHRIKEQEEEEAAEEVEEKKKNSCMCVSVSCAQ